MCQGSRVLVTGAGPSGLVCLQAAKAFGATYVAVSDVNPRRLECARELGASEAVNVGVTSQGRSHPASPWRPMHCRFS